MHKLILSFLLFTAAINYAQTKKDSKSILVVSTEPGFLRPFIESTIKELKNVDLDKLYFNEVYSLNNYEEDREVRSTITKILWDQANAEDLISTRPTSLEELKIQDQILKKLTLYDYFLTVKTNTLGELIEFQFQLFRTLEAEEEYGKKNYLKRVLVDNVIAVENFFINPKDSQYLVEIKNSIYRLFKGSNKRPISRLKIYGQDVKNNDTILVPIKTPFLLDASASYDFDTEKISYNWNNIPKPNENYQTFNKIDFETGANQQNITIEKNGIYLLQFHVNDGVLSSKELNIYLKTTEKKDPVKLKLSETTDYSYASYKYPEPISEHTVSYFINLNKHDSIKLLVTNKDIGNKYVEELHENNIVNYKIIDSVYSDRSLNNYTKEISIQSDFNNYPVDSINNFYIYDIDKDSILSEPKIFKHKYIHRKIGTVSLVFSSTLIQGYDFIEITSEGDSINKNNYSISALLEGSVYLTPRIELAGSFPFYSMGKIEIDEFTLKPHSSISFFANYYIVPKSDLNRIDFYIGVGGGFSNYYRTDDKDNTNEIVYIQEARAGVQVESLLFKKLSVSWGARYSIGRYNKSIFSDLYYINMGFVTKFRF
ncbi:hypothetical protein [Bizionia sp.]|uniref:hypothetical protein n=1 Tax=Bizionia sp. TaxID=1954480 RepID=UPI003A8DEE18